MPPLLKNLIIALVLVVVLGVGYFLFKQQGEVVGDISNVDAQLVAQETEVIIQNINRIEQYELNDSIFTDKRFTTLKNTRIDLPQVESGRVNPFSPTP